MAQAIQAAKAASKPLVVFLEGPDAASQDMGAMLHRIDLRSVLSSKCTVLRLHEDFDAPPHEVGAKYAGARQFRQIYPTDKLPSLAILATDGKTASRRARVWPLLGSWC